jgi:deazaflavin-dependent oxidoreductase (nitroreductase family)
VSDDDPEYAYLTTTGRRTGKSHRVEIWYRRIDDVVWFISGGRANADWVKNLLADPRVTIDIGGDSFTGTAFVDDQDAIDARRALAARYQGWRDGEALSGWATSGMTIGVRLDQRDAS